MEEQIMSNFNSKLKIIVSLLSLLFLTIGCENREKQLQDTGLLGEHLLNRIENFGAVTGSVSGNFFLGCGSVNGTIGSEFKLQFYWEPKQNVIIATSLSYSEFRFVIDESKTTPTVEFVFDSFWLKGGVVVGIIQEEDKVNLNRLIKKELVVAIIRISTDALEKEVYLPNVH